MRGSFQIPIDFFASRWVLHLGQSHRSSPVTSSVFENALMQSSRRTLRARPTGRDRNVNGENVTELWLQWQHVSLDLYWPWKWSTMIDWFRRRWSSQARGPATWSGTPSLSGSSIYSFLVTRLRSSCRPSSRNAQNSWP